MSRYEIPVVFDTESEPPQPLGIYTSTDEDCVLYHDPQGRALVAPSDCVVVVTCVVKVG